MIDFVRTVFGVSVRRACRGVPAPRSTYHYVPRRPPQDVLRKRIRELAETHVRCGYRRIHILLRREGWEINVKRVRRLYNLEGLQMRLKPPRRRVMAKLRSDRSHATGPSQIWAMDWMFDETFDGKRLWVLTVIDTWSRVSPVMRVCRSATAMEVVDALEEACSQYGYPAAIRVDQGCQFTSKELDLWAHGNGAVLDFSRPGKPTDNACAESFNAIVRMDCLAQHWFLGLDVARGKVETWRREYNGVRPHGAIGDRPPIAMLPRLGTASRAVQPPGILTQAGPDSGVGPPARKVA